MAWDREKEKKAGKAMTIGSGILAVAFLVFWNVMVASMGAWFMLIFGIPGLILAIYRLYVCIQHSRDAQKPSQRETDPWDRPVSQPNSGGKFCPYCGSSVEESFDFCPKCGRRQP